MSSFAEDTKSIEEGVDGQDHDAKGAIGHYCRSVLDELMRDERQYQQVRSMGHLCEPSHDTNADVEDRGVLGQRVLDYASRSCVLETALS